MSDEWQLPVPKEDPEARKESALPGGGGREAAVVHHLHETRVGGLATLSVEARGSEHDPELLPEAPRAAGVVARGVSPDGCDARGHVNSYLWES